MEKFISIVIPNYNRGASIEKCLSAAFSSRYRSFEVVVVDDCSADNSVEIIGRFPCTLIRLDKHSGASRARNTGALNSNGEILFFIDSDCLMQEDTLGLVNKAVTKYNDPKVVIGGTYAMLSYDNNFSSTFQSVFVNYSETRNATPDYIAAHAMIMDSGAFRLSSGFPEKFLPILEDVEFSHRLKRSGLKLVVEPNIVVRHIFNFSLRRSLQNAAKKARYWTVYSMTNKDLFADSGTASAELKINGFSLMLGLLLALSGILLGTKLFFALIPVVITLNLIVSRRLLHAFYRTKGLMFSVAAALYYVTLYPAAAISGAAAGAIEYFLTRRAKERPV